MLKGYFASAEERVDYGDASVLFPVEALDATVLQHRDAQLALAGADGTNVIIVAPTSLATSYALSRHTLTAIRVESLTTEVRTHIADAVDAPIETFDLIQIGKWNRDSPNHSLAEFTTA